MCACRDEKLVKALRATGLGNMYETGELRGPAWWPKRLWRPQLPPELLPQFAHLTPDGGARQRALAEEALAEAGIMKNLHAALRGDVKPVPLGTCAGVVPCTHCNGSRWYWSVLPNAARLVGLEEPFWLRTLQRMGNAGGLLSPAGASASGSGRAAASASALGARRYGEYPRRPPLPAELRFMYEPDGELAAAAGVSPGAAAAAATRRVSTAYDMYRRQLRQLQDPSVPQPSYMNGYYGRKPVADAPPLDADSEDAAQALGVDEYAKVCVCVPSLPYWKFLIRCILYSILDSIQPCFGRLYDCSFFGLFGGRGCSLTLASPPTLLLFRLSLLARPSCCLPLPVPLLAAASPLLISFPSGLNAYLHLIIHPLLSSSPPHSHHHPRPLAWRCLLRSYASGCLPV